MDHASKMSNATRYRRDGESNAQALLIIIAASLILSLSMGLRQSLGMFQPPMKAELGISASTFGMAMAIQSIVWGLSQPIIGILGDRFGPKPVLVTCALMYALGLVLMSSNGPFVSLDLGCGAMIGIGVAGTGFGVLIGTVSKVVPPERRSQTVGLVSALGSLGTLIVAPLGQGLIKSVGWRDALLAFALVAVIMAFVSIVIDRQGGVKSATIQAEDATASLALSPLEMLRASLDHRGFVLMTISFFACGFQLMFITAHLPQYLAICGVSGSTTAAALGLIGLGNAIGSYIFGQLGARYSRKGLLSTIYLGRTLVIVVFLSLPVNEATTLAFAAAMGFLWLGVVPLVGSLIGSIFGLRHFNTLFGVAFFSHQVGAFLGSWLGGISFDLTGGYGLAWSSMIVIGLTAATLQWFMDETPHLDGMTRTVSAA